MLIGLSSILPGSCLTKTDELIACRQLTGRFWR
jgi:hypothetical protein